MLSTRGLLVTLLASTFVAACSGGGGDGPADPGGPGPGPGGVVDLAATVDGPAAATGGERVTVRWSIRNVGEVASGWYAELRFGHAATPWEQREVADRLFGVMGTAPGETDSVTSELTLPAGLAAGTYQFAVRVTVDGDARPGNDLGVADVAIAGPACADDAFEPDDVSAEARPLGVGAPVARNFCFDAVDFGRVEARAGERLGLRLEGAGEPVTLYVLPADEPESLGLATLRTETPGVPVGGRFTAPTDGAYLLQAVTEGRRYGAGRDYTVTIHPERPDPRALALYVDTFHATPAGGVATVRLDVVNDGYEMPVPATVEFALSTDDRLDAGDRRVHRDTLPALPEGEWDYRDYLVPIPPDVATGEWFVIAIVDPDGTLPEIVEENNVSPADPIAIVGAECAPDPYEDDDRPGDAQPIAFGERQARNHCEDGHDWARFDAAAGDAFTIEADPAHGPQFVSLRVLAPSGAVAAEAEGSYGVVLTFTAAEAGTYRVEAGTDLFGDFQEYELVATRAQPDLTASALRTSYGDVVPGGVMPVRVDCRNLAATPSGPFTVGLWLSSDGALGASDVPVGELEVASATRGGACGGALTVMVPETIGTGIWTLLAKADPDGLVAELDETNNVDGEGWPVEITPALCAADPFDEDDLPARAAPLPLGATQTRNHCDDQRDWASIAVTEGDPLAIRLDQSTGSGFDLQLFAADGKTRLAQAWHGIFWRADRTGTVLVCAGCDDPPGSYAPASYRLTAALCPPDANEPDDALASARPIAPGVPVTLNGCDGTVDWLSFEAVADESYAVAVSSPSEAAQPTARFMDATAFPLPVTRSGEYAATVDGKVWIKVEATEKTLLESEYTVTLTVK